MNILSHQHIIRDIFIQNDIFLDFFLLFKKNAMARLFTIFENRFFNLKNKENKKKTKITKITYLISIFLF